MSASSPRAEGRGRRRAGILLAASAVVAAVALVVHGPIPQDPGYHAFADRRPCGGLVNAADVLSNLPFLAVGAAGFAALQRARRAPVPPPRWAMLGFALFSLGIATTAIGSAVYHLDPTNSTLVYDRLPMSLGFAAYAALVLGERVDVRLARAALGPAVALGVASVGLWAASLDGRGGDDLRPYVFVQYFSILTVVALLILVPEPRSTRRPLLLATGTYVLAKVLEALDGPVLRATAGLVSGHTLKHLAAAAAAYLLVRWFSRAVTAESFRDGPAA